MSTTYAALPLPPFYDPKKVDTWNWTVKYGDRFTDGLAWAKTHNISTPATDKKRIALLIIDAQLTFCHPDFELFVGGKSGRASMDDCDRLTQFIYRNLGVITRIHETLDTHTFAQIFHPSFWMDKDGNPPAPYTAITVDDIKTKKWQVNPKTSYALYGDPNKVMYLNRYVQHYASELEKGGQYALMVWPFHAMLGSTGHAMVPAVHEACFFHSVVRSEETGFEVKGGRPLTENYSVAQPEVLLDHKGGPVGERNKELIEKLLDYDYVIAAGEAGSHCFAWTIRHLLREAQQYGPELAKKFYLLRDCTSPVVTPFYDFTPDMEAAFADFEKAGMHVVESTTFPNWKDFTL